MVSFTVRMRFDEADHDAVKAALVALTEGSRNEPGCANYIGHFIDGDASTILIYEQYRDEAAVDHHRGTTHFRDHAIGGLYQWMKERHVETLVAVA